MLKRLQIQNIILIENGIIPFEEGFNVLSGETGSGKSAILHALNLIAGERSDASILRKGADKGRVEAAFDLPLMPILQNLFEEAGIEHDPEEELLIAREIGSTGKSRAYINNQMVQLSLLKQVGALILEMIGQHANQTLLNIENHRRIVDLFGGITGDAAHFAESYAREMEKRKIYEEWLAQEELRQKNREQLAEDLEELDAAQLKEGEEEQLFQEYTLLANAEELAHKTQEIRKALDLGHLTRHRNTFEQLTRIDQTLAGSAAAYDSALFELQEVAYVLDRYLGKIDPNPLRLQDINLRLTLLNRLKKKYGPSLEDIIRYRQNAQERLKKLDGSADEIEKLQEEIVVLSKQNDQRAAALTKSRSAFAQDLAVAVMKELAQLNMSKAVVSIDITPQKRSRSGDDRVEFFIAPNVGEHRIPLKESASGGELSRVLLALQTLLAGKAHIPTVVFDEIDANIGGATAAIIGEKLRQIGKLHQVICVTHFPQVARCANHHLRISKQEKDGRTLTEVDLLDSETRLQELARMQGNT